MMNDPRRNGLRQSNQGCIRCPANVDMLPQVGGFSLLLPWRRLRASGQPGHGGFTVGGDVFLNGVARSRNEMLRV